VTKSDMVALLKAKASLTSGAIEKHASTLMEQVWLKILVPAGAKEAIQSTILLKEKSKKRRRNGASAIAATETTKTTKTENNDLTKFSHAPSPRKMWDDKWGESSDVNRWLDFPELETQVFLVDWKDEFGEVLCSINPDAEGISTATELLPGTLAVPSYALEAYTDVRPVSSATVNFNDEAGPCLAALSVQDHKLLAKSAEWASADDRENGCFISSISDFEGDSEEGDSWSMYSFK
jgi:hypothetical protein